MWAFFLSESRDLKSLPFFVRFSSGAAEYSFCDAFWCESGDFLCKPAGSSCGGTDARQESIHKEHSSENTINQCCFADFIIASEEKQRQEDRTTSQQNWFVSSGDRVKHGIYIVTSV